MTYIDSIDTVKHENVNNLHTLLYVFSVLVFSFLTTTVDFMDMFVSV